jgi:hypothetical protein
VVVLTYNTRLEESKKQLQESFEATEEERQEADTQRQQAEAALQQAHFYQYFDHIARAHAGWREGNLGEGFGLAPALVWDPTTFPGAAPEPPPDAAHDSVALR